MSASPLDERIVTASLDIAAPASVLFELIADPARQPEWDGNDNLTAAVDPQRVRQVGDVFGMSTSKGKLKDNRVVVFEESLMAAPPPQSRRLPIACPTHCRPNQSRTFPCPGSRRLPRGWIASAC